MWTPEQDAELLRRWPTESANEIALAIGGVTRNAVIGRYYRLTGRYTEQIKEKQRLSRERTSQKRAAARSAAAKVLERMKSGQTREQAIIATLRDGALQADVAEMLGITRQRVSQIVLAMESV